MQGSDDNGDLVAKLLDKSVSMQAQNANSMDVQNCTPATMALRMGHLRSLEALLAAGDFMLLPHSETDVMRYFQNMLVENGAQTHRLFLLLASYARGMQAEKRERFVAAW